MTDAPADPFRERRARSHRQTRWLLGVRCEFVSESRRLLRIVEAACGRLPAQRLHGGAFECRIELRHSRGGRSFGKAGPPRVRAGSGAGLLTGIIDGDNHVVVAPAARAAGVMVSDALLEQPYFARYELVEFALLTLLSRVRGLVPLHAACVGIGGQGVLLLGESGAGKSTLCFHAALGGLRLLAEDSVFVEPRNLIACALPAFVHLRCDAPGMLGETALVRAVRASPVIRRRSGEQKYEVDMRRLAGARIAGPLHLTAVVALRGSARHGRLLESVKTRDVIAQMRRDQRYAAGQPGWSTFLARISRLPAFELARSPDPGDAVDALHTLLKERAR